MNEEIKKLHDLLNQCSKIAAGIFEKEQQQSKPAIDFTKFAPVIAKRLFVDVRYKYVPGPPTNITLSEAFGRTIEKIRITEPQEFLWTGGDCPIPDGVGFQTLLRDDREWSGAGFTTEGYRWSRKGSGGDIIGIRILPCDWQVVK